MACTYRVGPPTPPTGPGALRDAASAAFFHGFEIACLLAAAVAIAGAVMAIFLLPAQPPRPAAEAAIEPA